MQVVKGFEKSDFCEVFSMNLHMALAPAGVAQNARGVAGCLSHGVG